MQAKKSSSTLVEHKGETFEFSPVRELGEKRFVANVRNLSHKRPEEHVYSVFFDIEHENGEVHVRAVEGSCPSDKYHRGECKHREAAEESTALSGEVLGVALGIEGLDADRADDTPPRATAGSHRTRTVSGR